MSSVISLSENFLSESLGGTEGGEGGTVGSTSLTSYTPSARSRICECELLRNLKIEENLEESSPLSPLESFLDESIHEGSLPYSMTLEPGGRAILNQQRTCQILSAFGKLQESGLASDFLTTTCYCQIHPVQSNPELEQVRGEKACTQYEALSNGPHFNSLITPMQPELLETHFPLNDNPAGSTTFGNMPCGSHGFGEILYDGEVVHKLSSLNLDSESTI
ncbi:hypothetical protein H072_2079 [Dactylellina haptotyla CBS 200.50]|uniref:Uncharacterized protein n=1 Tax=Dactylellina haptotyla (strain CBS 200.50) TaxID=1284197 RepID=S8AM62_DACHA|nr:hypothetical protein H072_2079 [Dactylellina haptotyla CBS 200.50]